MPGSRRVVPLFVDETQVGHLRELLEQGESWVGRKRWVRWLDEGRSTDTMPIHDMTRDDRIAAQSWLRQQRHVLHDVIHGGAAPMGWIEEQPLYRGLDQTA